MEVRYRTEAKSALGNDNTTVMPVTREAYRLQRALDPRSGLRVDVDA